MLPGAPQFNLSCVLRARCPSESHLEAQPRPLRLLVPAPGQASDAREKYAVSTLVALSRYHLYRAVESFAHSRIEDCGFQRLVNRRKSIASSMG
jgi:hypothetical protein